MRNGRSATVPGSKTVSMWPISRTRGPPGPAVERADDRVAEPARRDPAGARRRRRARSGTRPTQRPTSFTPVGRVAAAVDVDQLARGRRGRPAGRRSMAARRPSSSAVDGSGRASVVMVIVAAVYAPPGACYPARTVRLVEIRLLEGPNVYRLEPVVKLEVAIGRRRTWYGQRDPGRHALVHLGRGVPARDWPDGVAAHRRLGPAAAASSTARAAAAWSRPSLVRPGPLDRHLPVDGRGARADADRGRHRPGRARRLAVADRPADRRPGSGSSRAGPSASRRPGPRRRPGSATPTGGSRSCRSRARTARRTVTRLITHILLLAGRHVGTTTSDGVLVDERMVDRATGPAPAARSRSWPGATSTSPSSRPPAAASSCAASATSRTRRAS